MCYPQGLMANHRYTRKFEGKRGSYNSRNPYYNPESCGLKIVGTAEKEPDWDFSIVLVVQDLKSGKLFGAYDTGCSCPTPFEDHTSLKDFTLITDTKQIDELADSAWGISKDQLVSLKRKVHYRLSKKG